MRISWRAAFGVFLCLAGAWRAGAESPPAQPAAPERIVWVAEIRGTINPASAEFLESTIKKAEADRAQAIIIELDTPGGLVTSVRTMAQAVDNSSVPVVVYVTPAGASATSAGALLMLAAHVGAMTPGTNIGAAHPVNSDGKDIEGAMGEKAVNDVAAFARGLAELRGRNQKIAEEVVSKSRSYTAQEALKEKIVDVLAASRSELFQQLDGRMIRFRNGEQVIRTEGAAVRMAEMSLGQKLLHLIAHPNIAAVLMTLGMLLIYVEVSNPGITIAGVLGGICFLIAFMALQVLPIQAGAIALVVLGIILMLAEPFVGSHGVLGGGGALAFLLGLLWLVDPERSDLRVSFSVWIPLALSLGFGMGVIGWAAARTGTLVKRTFDRIGGGGIQGLAGYHGPVESIEPGGLAGKALLRGEVWDFVSGEPVKVGDTVHAVSTAGSVVNVVPDKGGK